MCFVMQNPLPDHDVACVAFVISAGVQIAIVFRERSGGDDDAQAMPGGNHPRGKPTRPRKGTNLIAGGTGSKRQPSGLFNELRSSAYS